MSASPRPLIRAALALCLFLTIWGAKLAAIDRFGSDLPYWDQWAKEGDYLLTPWFERHELWKNLFLPHNEHRIAPTLALNLALVVDGGQWDARVQCVASAALHAAVAAGLFLWALRRLPRRWALATGAVLILATAPPIAWENVLGGFQSVFYFLAGFSLLALGGLLTAPALTPRWWGGLACGLLALVSMGSGFLVAIPVVAVATARLFSKNTPCRGALITLAAGAVLGGLGAWLRPTAPWHDSLHAHNAAEFITYAARCLAWPLPRFPWLSLAIWFPWLALLALRLKTFRAAPGVTTAATDLILATGAWVLLQIAAVTFSRAGAGGLPASRYGDIAALGLVLSFIALALLSPRLRPAPAATLGAVWFALATAGVCLATRDVLTGPLPSKKAESLAFEHSVQAFVLTDDYETFAKQPLPFPLPEWLARILRRPEIRAILPASVRAPLPIEGFSSPATPAAPPLPHRRAHTVTGVDEWRSATLPAGHGWWKIETTGPAFSASLPSNISPSPLLLLSASSPTSTARPLASIAPTRPPAPANWRAAYISAPREPATLFARPDSAGRWLAFSEPVEISSLSYRTWQLAKYGTWLLVAGLLGTLALATVVASSRPVSA